MRKGRNIVICGFSLEEKNAHYIDDVRTTKADWDKDKDISHRFPYLVYIETLKEALKHQGFILIINRNVIAMNEKDFDIKYRKKLSKYNLIMILSDMCHGITKANKFSRIIRCNYEEFFFNGMPYYIDNLYKNFSTKEIKITKNKMAKIRQLYKVMKKNKELSTKKISDETGFSYRNIQRYMYNLNRVYNCIGYDYSRNVWYFIDEKKNLSVS